MNKKIPFLLLVVVIAIVGGFILMNSRKEKRNIEKNNSAKETQQQVTDKDIKLDKQVELREEDTEESEGVAPQKEAAVGELAPDFKLKDLDGKEVSLSDFKGKKVLINFWQTTCPYCVKEMPDLDAISKENEDVEVLAVDVMEDQKIVKDYIDKGGYGFKVLLDTTGEIARQYLVPAFPTTYAIDAEGVIAMGVPGMLTKEQMQQLIAIMDEK